MIKVFLIERQKIVREGIKVLLEEESDFQVFTCENKDVKVSLLNRIKPDLILISLDNLDEADFSYLNIFLELNKNRDRLTNDCIFKIVIYAEKVNEFILNKALSIGCQGYLLKESSIEELKQAIRSIYRGYKHIGNSVFSQVKQLSIALNGVALKQDKDIAIAKDSYQTGLQTVGGIGSDELNYGNLKLNSSSSLDFSQEKLDNFVPQVNSTKHLLPSKPKNRWRELSWIILSISLGSMAGISAAWAYGDRYRPFSPIAKYGTINSNTVAVKTPSSGKIEQVNYQVWDLVGANDVIAQIEPRSIQQQKNALATEIEQTEQQIESENRLLASDLARIEPKRQQLQELLTNKIVKPERAIAISSRLDELKGRVTEAYKEYQSLKQLKEQNIISQSELTLARQTWLNARRELTQTKNSQQQPTLQIVKQLKIEQLQEKIVSWQTEIDKREKAIATLESNLAKLQNNWQEASSKLSDSQAIKLKAPFRGIVKQIKYPQDRVVNQDDTVFDLLSCQNLWVEVSLSGEKLRQIDFQQPVTFQLAKYRHNLTGQISSIESQAKFNNTKLNLPYYKTSISHSYLANEKANDEMMFKIIVNFPLLENYMQQQKFCGVGDSGLVTFNN
ncbi:MAG: HlyD family efflux transporter periplasmic adaptor subunit [Cyanobacteria bacterium P01_A01_bin.83]